MEGVQLDMKVTAAVSKNNLIIRATGSQILKHFQTARGRYDFPLAVQLR